MSDDPIKARGTPKSLGEAIRTIFLAHYVHSTSQVHAVAEAIIKDFLAQRFGAAMLNHPECEDILKELYEEIVRPEFKEPVRTIEEWKKKK